MSMGTNLLSPQWGYAQWVWTLICCHLSGIIPSQYGYKFVVTSVGLYPLSMDTNFLSSQWGYTQRVSTLICFHLSRVIPNDYEH